MRLKFMLAATALAFAAPAAGGAGGRFPAAARRALSLAAARTTRPTRPRSACATMTTASATSARRGAASGRSREAQAFLARVEAIPADQLDAGDRVTRAILRRSLAEAIEADGFGQRDMLFTTYDGWHQNFAGLARNLPFRTRADYESYLTRIAQYPRLNDQALAITASAVRGGYVLPCSVLAGHERTIAGVIAEDPAQSRFYEPFTRHAAGRASARPTGRRCRRGRGGSSPRRSTRPIASISISTGREYLPHCARSDSVSAPAGRRRILRLPGPPADDHRPHARSRSTTSACARSRGSAPRWRRSRARPASPSREAYHPGAAHQPALLSRPRPSS